jgi:hypothetical protein
MRDLFHPNELGKRRRMSDYPYVVREQRREKRRLGMGDYFISSIVCMSGIAVLAQLQFWVICFIVLIVLMSHCTL